MYYFVEKTNMFVYLLDFQFCKNSIFHPFLFKYFNVLPLECLLESEIVPYYSGSFRYECVCWI